MYDFKIEAGDKATLYRDLGQALEALIGDETDAIANMANAAGLIYETLPDVNWVGFYRNVGDELVLGPGEVTGWTHPQLARTGGRQTLAYLRNPKENEGPART